MTEKLSTVMYSYKYHKQTKNKAVKFSGKYTSFNMFKFVSR